jgi:DNA-binding MarR family transcriptional regulator
MSRVTPTDDVENTRILLSLLESVERDGGQTQRGLATELGIALGLVNAYVKRCVKKGLVKVGEVPTRRYAYYLTPQGFAEKSRLTVEFLSHSFSFFRQARTDCTDVFATARERGWDRVVLAGVSDLAEIARIASLESDVEVVGVVDAKASVESFVGLPVLASYDEATFDGVVVTDLRSAHETYVAAIERFDSSRVLAPRLLGLDARARRPAP